MKALASSLVRSSEFRKAGNISDSMMLIQEVQSNSR